MAKKYIDADKLKGEIKRRIEWLSTDTTDFAEGRRAELRSLYDFIDSLQQEQPEQPTRGYDESYLNDCIARAKKSWEGVDVDKYMDMVRGREPVADDLEEEVKNYFQGYWPGTETAEQCNTDLHFTPLAILRLARHFAGWQKEQDDNLLNIAYMDGLQRGNEAEREQLMKEAVEAVVTTNLANRPIIYLDQLQGFQYGDKVKVIVIKED